MIYIPPKGINLSFEELNKLLVVNNKNDNGNIYELMRVFSGINDQKHKIDNPTLFDFYNTNIFLDDSRQQLLKTTSIKPYVRAGGSLTSGTASSFFSNTNLGFDRSKLTSEQQKAFDVGNYGTAYDLEQTDEANSRAWDMFAKNNNPGQIVYLSSGFVQKNQDLIKAKGYGIMSYGDNATHFTTDSIDTKDGYNWFRPINTMIVTPKDGSSAEVEFLKTILSESYKDKLEKIGAKHLNDDEME
jgi:ABC-type phosphate transport system substrate-binding protein